jgi:hypothetical protein
MFARIAVPRLALPSTRSIRRPNVADPKRCASTCNSAVADQWHLAIRRVMSTERLPTDAIGRAPCGCGPASNALLPRGSLSVFFTVDFQPGCPCLDSSLSAASVRGMGVALAMESPLPLFPPAASPNVKQAPTTSPVTRRRTGALYFARFLTNPIGGEA